MNLKEYLKKARKEKWAIGQFNFSTLEQLKGILAAAKSLKSPVILGASEGEIGYLGLEETVALVEISKKKYRVPAFLNLDHGRNLDLLIKAIDYGFSAVHFDGSFLPLEKNVEYVKKIVGYAHKKGTLVEGEIEEIGGSNLTLIDKADDFVNKTKIDSLAIAIGNIHGMKGSPNLDLKRLREINKIIKAFLVLHGGSGISDSQIEEAIKSGIVKININTKLRITWKESLISALKNEEIKPYKILPNIQKEIQKKVEEKIKLFRSKNKI